ncbi:tRNA sulfurtransferase [Aeropyrum camini]|uniref:Probable tRNA sulfurtransferase n=1 Tax=Aeropyrum camini SY1 = JCM 12091 TaxID=1198449 RepID=U3TEQ8_9CREN|nr:tRNA sulfurtransferase [Aeropyrum camini]BAN89809.1 thiamine biosynthesis protein ThiI [Aeropyrum camini SY1 = JCM 12091]
MEYNVVLVRYSEIAVKGGYTRSRMERLLLRALQESLAAAGVDAFVERLQGRVIVRLASPSSAATAVRASARVFGVKSVSPAVEVAYRGLEELVEKAAEFFGDRVRGRVFRVRARRSGVEGFTSKDVERLLGRLLLERGARGVDLENPEYTAYVEVRGGRAYLFDTIHPGPGGLPVGSEEPSLALYSGGFDSGVAAWMIMRRGSPVHLAFYDFGVPEALEVAVEGAKTLAGEWAWGYRPRLYVVNFRGAALVVNGLVKPSYRTLVLRRLMMLHAQDLASREGYEALVTGESVGQVASQTVRNLRLISSGLDLPVLRPLAGMDKDEIVEKSREIGLYDIASRQVEVCGVDQPPNPRASPQGFRSEFEKARDVFIPPPRVFDLKGESLHSILKTLGLRG